MTANSEPRPDTVGGWLPIESAPKDGTGVLLIDMNSRRPEAGIGWFLFGKWSCVDPDGDPVFEPEVYHAMVWSAPTHWQPLPAPPQDQPHG